MENENTAIIQQAFRDEVLANLSCMRDIDNLNIPEFKFIQIKKSTIKTASN